MSWNPFKKRNETIARLTSELEYTRNQLGRAHIGLDAHQMVLDDIIAQEKPTSNSTVQRMANIARLGKKI